MKLANGWQERCEALKRFKAQCPSEDGSLFGVSSVAEYGKVFPGSLITLQNSPEPENEAGKKGSDVKRGPQNSASVQVVEDDDNETDQQDAQAA